MGQITLNKPSGGQLTLSPEDGTSTETVTIPSVGVGKVLQTAISQLPVTSTPSTTSSLWVQSGFNCSIIPKAIGSTLLIFMSYTAGTSTGSPYIGIGINGLTPDQIGPTNVFHQVQTDYAWASFSAHGTLIKEYVTTSLDPVVANLYFANDVGGTVYLNRSGTGGPGRGVCTITIMEVAA